MHRNVRAVVEAGRALGVDIHPREFPDSTRSAADAALAIGVDLGQIVKSLVFSVDGEVVVALVSGDNLLDEHKLAVRAGGEDAWREDADTVRDATGYPAGGVPPFGHREPLRVFVDEELRVSDVTPWHQRSTDPFPGLALGPEREESREVDRIEE